MSGAKAQNLFIGVKAEQSLRDAVREVVERTQEGGPALELAPVGRKDWIAGLRQGNALDFEEIKKVSQEVLRQLIALNSRQRIRFENIRIYAVPPPVPVFKDPLPSDFEEEAQEPETEDALYYSDSEETLGGPTVCPICNRPVHSYNLQHDTRGNVVGCFICGGDIGSRRR